MEEEWSINLMRLRIIVAWHAWWLVQLRQDDLPKYEATHTHTRITLFVAIYVLIHILHDQINALLTWQQMQLGLRVERYSSVPQAKAEWCIDDNGYRCSARKPVGKVNQWFAIVLYQMEMTSCKERCCLKWI